MCSGLQAKTTYWPDPDQSWFSSLINIWSVNTICLEQRILVGLRSAVFIYNMGTTLWLQECLWVQLKKKKKGNLMCAFVCACDGVSFLLSHICRLHSAIITFTPILEPAFQTVMFIHTTPSPPLLLIGGSDDGDCSSSFPSRTFAARDEGTCRGVNS